MFKKILVAFDGSDHSETALRIAADMAIKYAAQLSVVHIPDVETAPLAVGGATVQIPLREDEAKQAAEKTLEKAIAIAKQVGHEPDIAKVLEGDPAGAVLDFAETSEADLIAVGRRGLGGLTGVLLGSVSQKLTSHATCPVLTAQ